VATRSGNSRQPDETWSAWSEDLPDPAGSQAASPSARFIQFRATLRSTQPDATPALDEVSVAYLPTNLPPDIQEVRREGDPSAQAKAAGRALDAAGRLARTPRTPSAPGTPAPTPALRRDPSQATIQWRASDPNGDRLTYKLEFRGVEERLWKPLAERLSETTYAWDTSSVPDGRYLVKVIASDEADNPAGLALQTERVSDAITVDNTRPFLKSIKVAVDGQGRATIEGVARDDFGHVARVEVSLDGGAWFAVAAADGIADSREESFHHTTAPLAAGEHCVVVRMTDNAENVGAGKAVFVVAATGVGR
jgi:hypothetical protein